MNAPLRRSRPSSRVLFARLLLLDDLHPVRAGASRCNDRPGNRADVCWRVQPRARRRSSSAAHPVAPCRSRRTTTEVPAHAIRTAQLYAPRHRLLLRRVRRRHRASSAARTRPVGTADQLFYRRIVRPGHRHAAEGRVRRAHDRPARSSRPPGTRSATSAARSWPSTRSTGAILAMVSKPTYDPNLLARPRRGQRSQQAYDRLLNEDPDRAAGEPGASPATSTRRARRSSSSTAAAALSSGQVHAEHR